MKTNQCALVKATFKRKCGRKYFELFSLRRKRILLKMHLLVWSGLYSQLSDA